MMNRNRIGAIAGTIALLCIGCATAVKDSGRISLFDGTTLNGWVQKNGLATYRAENGTIVGQSAKNSPNSFLCSEREFGDFELTFDVKLSNPELNSGVQVRSQTKAPGPGEPFGRVNGPQVEIAAGNDTGSDSGYVYGEACGGWMTPDAKRVFHTAFKPTDWNSYRVVAKGPRIQTWINGQPIDDLVDDAKFATHPKGFIGLQVHGVGDKGPYEVAWRNIQIRPL